MPYKYDAEWKGLDQGVEHTWNPEVIETVTRLIHNLEPVEYTKPESPLYEELEKIYPDKKWRSYDQSDGSFRPIFRRSNTWAKLNLVEALDGQMKLSSLGNRFISGDIDLSQVLINALSVHEENGEKPFRILASAFLEKPNYKFTLEEIEFGIQKNYRPKQDSIIIALEQAEGSLNDNRKRRLRGILNRLNDVNAVLETSDNKWIAGDIAVLSTISNTPELLGKEDTQQSQPILKKAEIGKNIATAPNVNIREYVPISPTFKAGDYFTTKTDPVKRKEMLEKASKEHAETLKRLAEFLKNQGLKPIEDPQSYDLAILNPEQCWIFEVKTWTISNIKDQIRKAIAQLYEYNWRARDKFPKKSNLIIALNKSPVGFLEKWFFEYLSSDRYITLIWLDEDGKFKKYNASASMVEPYIL